MPSRLIEGEGYARLSAITRGDAVGVPCGADTALSPCIAGTGPQTEPVERHRDLFVGEARRHLSHDADRLKTRTASMSPGRVQLNVKF